MRLTWVQPEDLLSHQLVQSRSEGVDVPDEVQERWPWNRRSTPTNLHEVINGIPEDDDLNFGLALEDVELDDALDALHAEYGDLQWVHAVNNTALTAYALTAPDFATAVGRAVMGGWDTDSVGAAVGAVFGAVREVPAEWSTPLDNRMATSLPGMDQIAITELARRTVEVAWGGA